MKKLLFVTKDKRYWDQISMRRSDPRFFLMPAHDIGSARLFLESTRFDLMFVDIAGSSLDEFGLIGSVLAEPVRSVPLTVVSGAHSGAPRLTHGMGVLVTSRATLTLRDCEETLRTYTTLLRAHEPHGNGVHDLVELAGLEARSMSLGIRSYERKGWVFIQQGEIVDASNGTTCRPDLVDMLDDWPEVRFRVFPFSQATLDSAREVLEMPAGLLETRLFGEEAGAANAPPSPETETETEPEATAEAIAEAEEPPPVTLAPGVETSRSETGATPHPLPVEGLIAPFQTEVAGFVAALLVDRQGEILNLFGQLPDAAQERIATALRLLCSGGGQVLTNLRITEYSCLTLEAEDEIVACWPLGNALLAVISNDPRSLGKIRLIARRVLPDLTGATGGA